MFNEFRTFINRGNVLDLAVGVIIGAAFGTVVKSLVDDVIMPPIGLATGGVDFSDKYILLKEGATAGPYTMAPSDADYHPDKSISHQFKMVNDELDERDDAEEAVSRLRSLGIADSSVRCWSSWSRFASTRAAGQTNP